MKKIILVLIFFLALGLRLYHLDKVPPSLYWDEVSLGYNAYTISETGRDEHGVFMPLTYFAAFGDYKPPAYIYAVVPFIKLLGPTELAVRLPSALSGALLALVTFFLAKELLSRRVAFLASLFVAISPWSIQMSRAAFEANLATLLSGSGVLFFLLAKRKKNLLFFALSGIFFALSFYTFNSHRIFVPVLIVGLTLIFWRQLFGMWKKFLVFSVVLAILVMPLVPHMLSSDGRLRFTEVTWLKNLDIIVESNKKIADYGGTPLANIIFNRRVFYVREFSKHYLDHFQPDFLFLSGDINPRLSIQTVGEMYLIDALFILIGLVVLVKMRSKATLVLLLWLLTAPIPASFARETPHALRILNILPMPQIISAAGLAYLVKKWKFLPALTCLLLAFSCYFYLSNYYFIYPKTFAEPWQYGYKEVVHHVKGIEDHYEKINVTSKYGRPYIYFLFYGRVPLDYYLTTRQARKDSFGFWQVDGFGNYEFIERGSVEKKWLYVRKAEDVPESGSKKLFFDPNGIPLFAVTEQL